MILYSDTELIVNGRQTSNFHNMFSKITWGTATPDWVTTHNCPTANCGVGPSYSCFNSDKSILYTASSYGATQNLHFVVLQTNDGSSVGSRYLGSSTSNYIYGLKRVGTIVYGTFLINSAEWGIFKYDTETLTMDPTIYSSVSHSIVHFDQNSILDP